MTIDEPAVEINKKSSVIVPLLNLKKIP